MMGPAGSLINFIPFTGMGFRAFYLKKIHGLKYVDFGIGMVIDLATGYISAGVIGLFGLWVLYLDGEVQISSILVILFIIYVIGPLIFLYLFKWFQRKGWEEPLFLKNIIKIQQISDIYHSIMESMKIVLLQPRIVFRIFIINFMINMIIGSEFYLVGSQLGYPVVFTTGLILRSVSILIAITPLPNGTIGLREATTGLGTTALGDTIVSGVMISTIERIISTAWIALLGSISMVILYKKISSVNEQSQNP